MLRFAQRYSLLWLVSFGLALLVLPLSGCDVMNNLEEALYPTNTPGGEAKTSLAVSSAIPATEAPPPEPTVTSAPTKAGATAPTAAATPRPGPGEGYQLVLALNGRIYRGDALGAQPVEVADIPQLYSWAFARGLLAMAEGRRVDIVDLTAGTSVNATVNAPPEIEHADVHWGAPGGKTLLYVADIIDKAAPTFGRSVELRVLAAQNGAEQSMMVLRDVNGVDVLRYDEDAGRVTMIIRGGDPSFTEVQQYDVRSGRRIAAFPAQGEGQALLSPDGQTVLVSRYDAQSIPELVLYPLAAGSQPKVLRYPEGTHGVSPIWSPDGRYIAFLLREGITYGDEAGKGLGVWVLDVNSMQAAQVMDEASISSSLVGWTPDGGAILGYHRAEAESHFYTVRPDGGDRRILSLEPQTEVLGWMPAVTGQTVTKVSIDPWQGRFQSTVGNSAALAEVVAQFVATKGQSDEATLAQQVAEQMTQAGWQTNAGGPAIKRVVDGLFIVHLPSMAIYVLDNGRAQQVASGNVILDARLQGDDLGLIFGATGANATQAAFGLLRRQADGAWQPLWTAQGQRDWIATDGEIRFAGEGLQSLQVTGTSFGLDMAEELIFNECHACPHRHLVATWVRQGDLYQRQTKLAADAPLGDVYWEMTQRTAYAVLYETLRRVRRALPVDDLVAEPGVLNTINEFGLANSAAPFLLEEETTETVRFGDAEGKARYQALVQAQRLVRIERLGN